MRSTVFKQSIVFSLTLSLYFLAQPQRVSAMVGEVGLHSQDPLLRHGGMSSVAGAVQKLLTTDYLVERQSPRALQDNEIFLGTESRPSYIKTAVADSSLLFTRRKKGHKRSPSHPKEKGNNGVGNGLDPQPPGNPPINDGPGTGPGNPGNKGGAKKIIRKNKGKG